jgi:very-short-patch-repair endonuclease
MDTLLALARHLGLLDLVVLLDSALHLGDITLDQLASGLAQKRWGVLRLRDVARLADGRAESAFETLLRLLHVVCDARVTPQFELRVDGDFVARGDLRLVGTDTFHEYDGAGHRGRLQHRSDLRRDRAITAAGWQQRGYTDRELLRRPIEILRDIDRALGREHDASRIDAWYALLRGSCFTASGRHVLLSTLGLTPILAAS